MANFEGYERRIDKINSFLAEIGFDCLEEAQQLCLDKGVDVAAIVRGIQPIAFDNAVWAYTLGAANAIKSGSRTAAGAAEKIGEGLQAFCVPGSVADQRKVGLGHGNLAAKLLAVKPSLTPRQLVAAIVDTAERTPDGRRVLVDPKKALAAVGGL